MASKALLACALLLTLALAGCTGPEAAPRGAGGDYAAMGFDGQTWPSLAGRTVTVLAYSSFGPFFGDLQREFKNLTGADVALVTEDDTGAVLARALRERGQPSFDVLYGLDNVLLGQAAREDALEPYVPRLAGRIDPAVAFDTAGLATPVDHGYVAVNVDAKAHLAVRDLNDVRANAARFATEDPRTSSPGLGFMLATVATYGEAGATSYDWLDYWQDLFAGGTLVTAGWTEAYAGHFTGGYGQSEPGARVDKALVTSYTTSPAYEMYYGYDALNDNVLAPKATFHQVQTMAIARGARDLAAAQAWVEFCLTDAFQDRVAAAEAIYPIVAGADTAAVYRGRDPAPGTFQDTGFTPAELDAKVEGWLRAWTDAYERARAGP